MGQMLRRHFKQREAFRETASTHIKQLNAAVDLAVAAMDEPWRVLEKGWEKHQQHLVEIGIRPATGNEGVLRLNIGGLPANVHRSLIAEAEGFSGSTLGSLFEQMWDKRGVRVNVHQSCVECLDAPLQSAGLSYSRLSSLEKSERAG